MTAFYGAGPTWEDGFAVIRRAHELGVTLFDTAELYNLGTDANEALVGEGIAPFRDEAQIATKFGNGYDEALGANRYNSRPENIRRVPENSLRHLRTDVIDVLYQHRPDPQVPVEEVAETVGQLIAEGKVAAQLASRTVSRRAWFGAVDDQRQAGVGGRLHRLEAQV